MKTASLLLFLALLPGLLPAADVPAQPLAKKGALIFSDDFAAPALGKAWRVTFPTFEVVDGKLKVTQTKPEHNAVGRVPVAGKDLVIEFKFQLGGASGINAVCNDPEYKEGHAGHICRVTLQPKEIFLGDDKERLTHEIEEMKKDPARKAEVAKLIAGKGQNNPMTLDPARWYALAIEIVGEEMRVSLDGKPVGYLKSAGVAHPTKREFYFSVGGASASFDDLKIWAAEPAK